MALWIKIIIAILLPPLAVFLHIGIGLQLLISVLLTLCFWLPGQVHAIWVLIKK